MDINPEKKRKLTKWVILTVAACILIFLGVQNIGAVGRAVSWCFGIVMPLVIGCAIALIVNVPMGFLERHLWAKSEKRLLTRLRRPISFILSFLFVIGILVGVVAIVLPQLVDTVTVIVKSAIEIVNDFNAMSDEEIAALPFGEFLLDVDWNKLLESTKSWLANRASLITNSVFGTVTSLVGGVIDLFVSVVFSIYVLSSKERLKSGAQRIARVWFPKKQGEWCIRAASILSTNMKNFIVAQFIEAIIIGLMCFVGMLIFGFPYAAMISVLVGVTALIPIVGSFIGGGVGAFMMLTVDPMKAVWFLVFFIILQQFEGNVIYPKTVGSRVKLPGMWILAAVTVGGGIGGTVGMLLGVPIASTLYTLFNEATEKREKRQAGNRHDGRRNRADRPRDNENASATENKGGNNKGANGAGGENGKPNGTQMPVGNNQSTNKSKNATPKQGTEKQGVAQKQNRSKSQSNNKNPSGSQKQSGNNSNGNKPNANKPNESNGSRKNQE